MQKPERAGFGTQLGIALATSTGSMLFGLLVNSGSVYPSDGGLWGVDVARMLGGLLITGLFVLLAAIGAAIVRRWIAFLLLLLFLVPASIGSAYGAAALGEWRDDRQAAAESRWWNSPLDSAGLTQQIEERFPGAQVSEIKRFVERTRSQSSQVVQVVVVRDSAELRPAEVATIAKLALQYDSGANVASVGPGRIRRPVKDRCTQDDQVALTCGSWPQEYRDKYQE